MSSKIIRIECVKFGAHVNIHDLVVRNIKEGPNFAQSALLPRGAIFRGSFGLN